MNKNNRYQLSEEEVQQLEQAMRDDGQDDEVVQRLAAIHQLHRGSSVRTVARESDFSESTIYRWREKFKEGGVKALSYRRSRQRRSLKAEVTKLRQELSKAQEALETTQEKLNRTREKAQESLQRARKEAQDHAEVHQQELEVTRQALKKTQEKLNRVRKEAQETQDNYDSLAANVTAVDKREARVANDEKRIKRKSSEFQLRGSLDTLESLLPVIDDFDRAFENVPEDISENSWIKGVEMIQHKFEKLLGKYQIEAIDPTSKPFDPDFHDAIGTDDRDEVESGHVTVTLQKGYRAGEHLLRPALVRVAS